MITFIYQLSLAIQILKYMDPNLCEPILSANIRIFILAHEKNYHKEMDNILKCLNDCLRPLFLKWARLTYPHYLKETIAFNADISFTDAVLKIQTKAFEGELYEGNAVIKTVVFIFFRNILRDNLQRHNRLEEKNRRFAKSIYSDRQNNISREHDDKEAKMAILEQALSSLNAADRQIIIWRHIDGKKNDEIAQLLKINIPSATNRIYRCMERLKIEMEKIQLTNGYDN